MKQRNAARRFSKYALRSAGQPPLSWTDVASRMAKARARREKALERAAEGGRGASMRSLHVSNGAPYPKNDGGKRFFGCSKIPDMRVHKAVIVNTSGDGTA